MNKLPAYLILAVLSSSSIEAYADSLRCKKGLIQIGDYKADILLKCGEPFLKDKVFVDNDEVLISKNSTVIRHRNEIDQWTYKLRRGMFLTILDFKGGKLESIHYGNRINE
ncbi:MAG: DUF2845 domain-containing protein [Gammaproteobacteria bacterium]|nr:DUF2845 domain-containing protein [Gammaproteobacteria bacterium]